MYQIRAIENKFNISCNHRHNHCKSIETDIITCINNGVVFTNDFLGKYLRYLNGTSNCYSICYKCTITWIQCVISICKIIIPIEDNVNLLINMSGHNNNDDLLKLFGILINGNMIITDEYIKIAISKYNLSLVELFINKKGINSYYIELLCNNSNIGVTELVGNILNKQKVNATETALLNAINNKNYQICHLLIQSGCDKSILSLNNACLNGNNELMHRILSCKIEPNGDTFLSICKSVNGHPCYIGADNASKNFDLIFSFGYLPNYNDILKTITYKCYVNKISRFNIQFQDDFIVKCSKMKYYPYQELKLKFNVESLRIECARAANIGQVKAIIESGIKPDIECLQNALSINGNQEIIQYLMEEHGLVPNLESLKQISFRLYDKSLSLVISSWKDNNVIINIPQHLPKTENIVTVKDDVPEKDDIVDSDIIKDLKYIKLSRSIPTNKREKKLINTTVYELFDIKKQKLSFLDLRKHLITYISCNNLFNCNDKTIILPNKKIKRLLKLKGDYIEFNDINLLASILYL